MNQFIKEYTGPFFIYLLAATLGIFMGQLLFTVYRTDDLNQQIIDARTENSRLFEDNVTLGEGLLDLINETTVYKKVIAELIKETQKCKK